MWLWWWSTVKVLSHRIRRGTAVRHGAVRYGATRRRTAPHPVWKKLNSVLVAASRILRRTPLSDVHSKLFDKRRSTTVWRDWILLPDIIRLVILPSEVLWWVCMSVCLSARISQKRYGWTSRNFYACCVVRSFSDGVRYCMYFRFCGWRHVFTQWALRCIICIPMQRELTTADRNCCIDFNQILLNDEDQQIHILGCKCSGAKLLSTIALL